MTTQQDWAVPRRRGSEVDFAMTGTTIEVARRLDGLRAEADRARRSGRCAPSLRVFLGELIVRLGEAVSGAELHRHAVGHRVG